MDCTKYLYDDKPGHYANKPVIRNDEPVERIPLVQLPLCRFCPKIPVGARPVPASAIELSERNACAYLHYRRCKAVGRFPVDAIVERNAGIILTIEEEARDLKLREEQAVGLAGIMASLRRT